MTYIWKLGSLGYIFAAHSMGLSFRLAVVASQKMRGSAKFRENLKVMQGHRV